MGRDFSAAFSNGGGGNVFRKYNINAQKKEKKKNVSSRK
jgi:hypothetical protein